MLQLGRKYCGLNGKYTVENEMDEGGMGVTYAATKDDGQNVVIKSIQTMDAEQQKPYNPKIIAMVTNRLNTEAKILKSFTGSKSPNVVTYLDQAKDPNEFFFVMEKIDGTTLHNIIKSSALSEKNVIRYSLDILTGLEFIHKHGTVHRDLKPANIMINKNNQCVLIDFGAAKQGHRNLDRPKPSMPATLPWRCPHQGITGNIHEECDLYSFGRIMFAMIAGCTENQLQAYTTKGRMNVKLHELGSHISMEMSNLIDKIIDPDHTVIHTASELARRISSLSSIQKPARIQPVQNIKKFKKAVPKQQNQFITCIVLQGIEYQIPNGLKGILIGRLHDHTECWRSNNGCNRPNEGENISVGFVCEKKYCRCNGNIAHVLKDHHMRIWKDSSGQVFIINLDPTRKSAIFRNGVWTVMNSNKITQLNNNDRVALLYSSNKGPFEDFAFHER